MNSLARASLCLPQKTSILPFRFESFKNSCLAFSITAVGVDPQTQDAWTAISDTLVHLDSSGNIIDIYYLVISDQATLKPTSILVEPDRILIASDAWGIYEFPRPDKPSGPVAPRNSVVPQHVAPAPTPASSSR
jgi:hypothetical protein